jgi:hypothetical protein
MGSKRQNVANKKNAQRSTGPRTEQGKWNCRMNAWMHGLTAKFVCEKNEVPLEFEHYRINARLSMLPASDLEEALVERIAIAGWKQKRILAMEHQVMATFLTPDFQQRDFDNLLRYKRAIERECHTCIIDLDRMQKNRDRMLRIVANGLAVERADVVPELRNPFDLQRLAMFTLAHYAKIRKNRMMKPLEDSAAGPRAQVATSNDETKPIEPAAPVVAASTPEVVVAPAPELTLAAATA